MRRSAAPSQVAKTVRSLHTAPLLPYVKQEDDSGIRRFEVLFGRISTKTKQKTWEKDGTMHLIGNRLTLQQEGVYVCDTVVLPGMQFKDDAEIIMEPYEVKIVRECGKDTRDTHSKIQMAMPDNDYKFPRQEAFVPKSCLITTHKNNVQNVRQEEYAAVPIKRMKEEPRDKIEKENEPLIKPEAIERQEIIICCRPTTRQNMIFEGIHKEIETHSDPKEFLQELEDCCNFPINRSSEVSAKLPLSRVLIQNAVDQGQSVLVIAINARIQNELHDYCTFEFGKYAFLLNNEDDVQEAVQAGKGAKIYISSLGLLEAIRKHRIHIHRTVIYENFAAEESEMEMISLITQGPVYTLLICGSIEERLFQLKHHVIGDEGGISWLIKPGSQDRSETHRLLKCHCCEDEDPSDLPSDHEEEAISVLDRLNGKRSERAQSNDLKDNWEHIPGNVTGLKEHLEVSGLFLAHK